MNPTSTHPVRPLAKAIALTAVSGVIMANMALSALAAGDLSPLKGILLDSSGVETRIVLQSTDAIPYKVVSKSADSIVLDLTVNGASDAVQTDFAQAKNIEQVILKPVNSQQLRVIIRGEHLADPVVLLPQAQALKKSQQALKEVIAPRVSDAKATPAANASKKADAKLTASTDTAATNASAPTDATTSKPANEVSETDAALAELDSETPLDLDAATSTSDRTAIGAMPSTQTEGLSKNLNDDEESESPLDSIFSLIGETLSGLISLSWGNLLKLLVVMSAALVFFQWARRRPQGKQRRLGSIDAAPTDSVWAQLSGIFGETQPKRKAAPQRELQPHQRPVGLRGLEELTTPAYIAGQSSTALRQHQGLAQYSQQAQAPLLETPTLRNREIIDRELDRSLTRRQAIEDYYQRPAAKAAIPAKPTPSRPKSTIPAKNNSPRPTTATRRPVASQQPIEPQRHRGYEEPQRRQTPAAKTGIQPAHFERLDRTPRSTQAPRVSNQSSLGRVANHGGQFGTTQPARRLAQPMTNTIERPVMSRSGSAAPTLNTAQTSGQWDLKHNTNVLDFLRDVADLVEKEGNAPAARGLKKGLASTVQG